METYLGASREANLSDEMNEAVMRRVIRNIRKTIREPNEDTDFRAIAETTMRTAGCCRKLSDDELFEILQECR